MAHIQIPLFLNGRHQNITEQQKLLVEIALAAFLAMYTGDRCGYFSSAISSGVRAYEAMDRHGFKTMEELKKHQDIHWKEVKEPNILATLQAVKDLGDRLGIVATSPGKLELKGESIKCLSQEAFMALWGYGGLIEHKITDLQMDRGWQLSDGGTEECLLTQIMRAGILSRSNIQVMDLDFKPLNFKDVVGHIIQGYQEIQRRGFASAVMEDTLFKAFALTLFISDIQKNPEAMKSSFDFHPDILSEDVPGILQLFKAAGPLMRAIILPRLGRMTHPLPDYPVHDSAFHRFIEGRVAANDNDVAAFLSRRAREDR